MKKNNCFIIPYIGKMGMLTKLSLEQVSKCVDEVFVFTDDKLYKPTSPNIKVTHVTLEFLSELFSKKLNMNVKLKSPYKICDFKPLFGICFNDYVSEYEHFSFGDVDCLYSSKFETIINQALTQFELLQPTVAGRNGHFMTMNKMMYENVLNLFITHFGYEKVEFILSHHKNFAFDEYLYLHNMLDVLDSTNKAKWIRDAYIMHVDASYWHRLPFCYNRKSFIDEIQVINGETFIKVNERLESVPYIHLQKRKVLIDTYDCGGTLQFDENGNCSFGKLQANKHSKIGDFKWKAKMIVARFKSKLFIEKLFRD
ncbi:DUF6625 family protein [Vibrio jasicida]|uniref:DUF6625 family protein n=1 Tax=Vibrio jasicida TaxID=766224 RepID=UPI0005EDD8AF|nr:DUF6625 family protein [Vibrio jasicida]